MVMAKQMSFTATLGYPRTSGNTLQAESIIGLSWLVQTFLSKTFVSIILTATAQPMSLLRMALVYGHTPVAEQYPGNIFTAA